MNRSMTEDRGMTIRSFLVCEFTARPKKFAVILESVVCVRLPCRSGNVRIDGLKYLTSNYLVVSTWIDCNSDEIQVRVKLYAGYPSYRLIFSADLPGCWNGCHACHRIISLSSMEIVILLVLFQLYHSYLSDI
jgi:hypothetical protein